MSKYLDLNGLSTLWGKIKAKFATKDELNSGLSSKQNVLGINPTGSANKFLNQKGQFATVEADLSAYAKKADIPTTLPASDVKAWAKADTKPTYTKDEVGLGNVDNTADSAKDVKHAKSADSVAWSGVTGKPTIPDVNDSVITINQGGNKIASFSLNQKTGETIDLPEGKMYSNATQTSDGLMSSADKKKLDGMGTGGFLTQEDADKRYMAKEHVIVTMTTTVGSVEGLKVHVQDSSGNEIAVQADLTWKGTAIEFDISAGVAYKIVGDALSVDKCVISRSESAIRVSSTGSTNNVTLAYNPQKLSLGVYIETLDGKAVTADKYTGGLYQDNPNVNSVLVVTSSWTGRILPVIGENIKWTPSSPGGKVAKTMTNNSSEAEKDMDGMGNTEALFNKYNKNIAFDFAAGYAYNQIFRSGKHGYQSSLGELKIIYANQYEVKKCLYKLTGIENIVGNYTFWSSTQDDSDCAWYWQRSSGSISWSDGNYVLVLSA
jgi:hypothetical protein